eukprot:5111620-Amphidinium_carterae.1
MKPLHAQKALSIRAVQSRSGIGLGGKISRSAVACLLRLALWQEAIYAELTQLSDQVHQQIKKREFTLMCDSSTKYSKRGDSELAILTR